MADYSVKRRTLRVDMQMNTIIIKMGEILKDIAEYEGVPEVVVDMELSKLAKLSVRVQPDANEWPYDFQLIDPDDTIDEVRMKFAKFLDTEMVEVVDEMVAAISRADSAVVSAHAPDSKKKT